MSSPTAHSLSSTAPPPEAIHQMTATTAPPLKTAQGKAAGVSFVEPSTPSTSDQHAGEKDAGEKRAVTLPPPSLSPRITAASPPLPEAWGMKTTNILPTPTPIPGVNAFTFSPLGAPLRRVSLEHDSWGHSTSPGPPSIACLGTGHTNAASYNFSPTGATAVSLPRPRSFGGEVLFQLPAPINRVPQLKSWQPVGGGGGSSEGFLKHKNPPSISGGTPCGDLWDDIGASSPSHDEGPPFFLIRHHPPSASACSSSGGNINMTNTRRAPFRVHTTISIAATPSFDLLSPRIGAEPWGETAPTFVSIGEPLHLPQRGRIAREFGPPAAHNVNSISNDLAAGPQSVCGSDYHRGPGPPALPISVGKQQKGVEERSGCEKAGAEENTKEIMDDGIRRPKGGYPHPSHGGVGGKAVDILTHCSGGTGIFGPTPQLTAPQINSLSSPFAPPRRPLQSPKMTSIQWDKKDGGDPQIAQIGQSSPSNVHTAPCLSPRALWSNTGTKHNGLPRSADESLFGNLALISGCSPSSSSSRPLPKTFDEPALASRRQNSTADSPLFGDKSPGAGRRISGYADSSGTEGGSMKNGVISTPPLRSRSPRSPLRTRAPPDPDPPDSQSDPKNNHRVHAQDFKGIHQNREDEDKRARGGGSRDHSARGGHAQSSTRSRSHVETRTASGPNTIYRGEAGGDDNASSSCQDTSTSLNTEVKTTSHEGEKTPSRAYRPQESGRYGSSNVFKETKSIPRFGNGQGPTIDVDAPLDRSRYIYAPSSRSMPSSVGGAGSIFSDNVTNTPDSVYSPSRNTTNNLLLERSGHDSGGGSWKERALGPTSPGAMSSGSAPAVGSRSWSSPVRKSPMSRIWSLSTFSSGSPLSRDEKMNEGPPQLRTHASSYSSPPAPNKRGWDRASRLQSIILGRPSGLPLRLIQSDDEDEDIGTRPTAPVPVDGSIVPGDESVKKAKGKSRFPIGLTLLTPDSLSRASVGASPTSPGLMFRRGPMSPVLYSDVSSTNKLTRGSRGSTDTPGSIKSMRRGHSMLRERYDYVFLDFDHVLTNVMLGIRSKNRHIPPVEGTTNKEFGGAARVEKLRELFELWQAIGVNFFVISKGRLNRIEKSLENVDLFKYLENKIYALDSNGVQQRKGKRDEIMRVLGTNNYNRPDVLFIDDSLANLTLAEDVCMVYQPDSGEGGQGLSLTEICCLIDGAKATSVEQAAESQRRIEAPTS